MKSWKQWGLALSFDPQRTISELAPWDVIYPFDNRIHPTKHKMWVCVSKADLWFLRINSRRYDGCCLPMLQAKYSFLNHDSHLRCGGDLISVVEAELEVLLGRQVNPSRQGVIGTIHHPDRFGACSAIGSSALLAPAQVRTIARELNCPSLTP